MSNCESIKNTDSRRDVVKRLQLILPYICSLMVAAFFMCLLQRFGPDYFHPLTALLFDQLYTWIITQVILSLYY